jgi:type IV pilus assembly protein PilV
MSRRQAGFSLIEVLVALLVMCIGLLGAAAIQLNALKYTDSSSLSSQASFIAYDMMDRIRANTDNISQYALTNLASAPTTAGSTAVSQDLTDFRTNITNMSNLPGTDASIVLKGYVVTITIVWNDTRAGTVIRADNSSDATATTRNFVLVSRVAADGTAYP